MSSALRIAVFVGTFPVISETFILRQITGLLELGNDVEVFADLRAQEDGPEQPEVEKYGLRDRTAWMDMPPECAPWELPVWPLTGKTWLPGATTSVSNAGRLTRAAPALLRSLVASPRLTKQLLDPKEYSYRASSLSGLYRLARLAGTRGGFEVLHAHFGPVGNSFRFARALWGAPLVVSFHGYDFSTLPRREGPRMYERLFATADAFTVNSEYTRRQVEQLGCQSERIHHLPVGLNPQEFPFRERTLPPGAPVRILTVGRLVEIKGHEYLLRAIARLREKYPVIQCEIAGDGPLRKKLEELSGELGVKELVTLHGAVSGEQIKRMMAEAHIFVLPSVSVEGDQEGQGLALQEAQASGLPVIATRHGALPEGLLPGQSGFLVPERDPVALAEQIQFLIDHPELWPRMGRRGREFVLEHFDIRKLNSRLVELYRKTIEGYRSRAQHVAG